MTESVANSPAPYTLAAELSRPLADFYLTILDLTSVLPIDGFHNPEHGDSAYSAEPTMSFELGEVDESLVRAELPNLTSPDHELIDYFNLRRDGLFVEQRRRLSDAATQAVGQTALENSAEDQATRRLTDDEVLTLTTRLREMTVKYSAILKGN